MREMSLKIVVLLVAVVCTAEAAKCRGRYMEMRGGDGFVTRGGCRGLDTQIQEEYWTTIGYDGVLRDGRTTDDFLTFPEHENNGHSQRNSFVGYWITRTKYGQNHHYEAFGHAFIKPDGRVCGWFVGLEKEVVEVCGGFRVLSRSRRNPHEQIPFEWVQGAQYRNRDVLGFHHHKIAKYEQNGDDVFFGDADINGKKFQGVSPVNEQFIQLTSPEDFHRKVWLLRKKSTVPPSDIRVPQNIVEPRRREDLDIYHDPHHEARISNMRLYPYYDQYGRPSGSQIDSHRPAYDASGRRISFDSSTSQNSQNSQNFQNPQNIQYPDSQQAPPRDHPSYESWLRNQYRIRGIVPRNGNGYNYQQSSGGQNQVNYNPERRPSQTEYQQPAYVLQPSSDNQENERVVYPGSSENTEFQQDVNVNDNSDDAPVQNLSNDQDQQGSLNEGDTYYSVNPGNPGARVESTGSQSQVNGDHREIQIPRQDEDVSTVRKEQDGQHIRFIRYRPATVIRDKKGNLYERRVENGKVYYIDASGNQVNAKISNSDIDMKIEQVLENRRLQEEKMRGLVGDSTSGDDNPRTAADEGRQG